MARDEPQESRDGPQEPRNRSNSLTAAWSYLFRGSKSSHQNSSRSPKHQTIIEGEEWGKGITRKVLPQRRSTSSVHSSPTRSSHTSPRMEPSGVATLPKQQQQPSALERIAIHNDNINSALASTIHHSISLPPFNTTDVPSHYQTQQQHQHQHQHQSWHRTHERSLDVPETHAHEATKAEVATTGTIGNESTRSDGFLKSLSSREGCGTESADSAAHSTITGVHRSPSPASCCTVSSTSCPSPHSDKDNFPSVSSRPTAVFKQTRGFSSSSSSSSSPRTIGLGLIGIPDPQESPDLLSHFIPPTSGPSYFDITPSSSQTNGSSAFPKKLSNFNSRALRRSKRTSAHSVSSTITNGGMPSSRRVSCTDTASQNSNSYIDEQDLDVDENSFYVHLQKMQERHQAQQEGWLRTQHTILQTKHRGPGSRSPQHDHKGSFAGKKGSFLPVSQPFLSRIHSQSSSSLNNSDYGTSPSFHGQNSRQNNFGSSSFHRNQPTLPLNCFQPGNVICIPRERTLGGLIFHKTFVETHILTPSPYYRGQYLTLDHKVVEIDKDFIREISGFSHPRSVKILTEVMVYNAQSKKPTRVLVLERPLVGDGIPLTRPFDGPTVPGLRQTMSDMAFLESFPELSRALRDFNTLCQEFENTYVYIRGFATHTLEKLRLIYEKAYRDCVGDSVKLQKMLDRGIAVEQENFAELMENVVLGKLYQKLFIHSLVPCYSERDIVIDDIVSKYHHYMFAAGAHRGIDVGECLAATGNPLQQEALRKLELPEKWRTMRFDLALQGAANLLRAWDQDNQDGSAGPFSLSQRTAMANHFHETEQERSRHQLRESLRALVQDDKYKSGKMANSIVSDETEADQDEEDDPLEDAVWNTPVEKAYCIKLVLDMIAAAAEEHLMNGQGFGFVHKKRSEVSVTTDDFIPLLAIVIIQAKITRLGSNLFYIQRFRINTPKPDLDFALVTFETSINFLKSDPLKLLNVDNTPTPLSSQSLNSASRVSLQGSHPRIEIDQNTPVEENQLIPWGTPSQTGWGFSPPNAESDALPFDLSTSCSEKSTLGAPPIESSLARPFLSTRVSDSQQYQQRHFRSASMNFDDRFRRVSQADEGGNGSSNNNSWSRSPMLGPRFTSGANSPLGTTFSSQGEAGFGSLPRRPSHQLTQMPQRHSISNVQAHTYTHSQQNHHLSRISGEYNRPALQPMHSPSMTPQLVVKPQIMLPPPKTPPMSGQNTTGRARPISMGMGALASSTYSSSYGAAGGAVTRKSFSSNYSSPATSPQLGPGIGSKFDSRSNSLVSGAPPMSRANSANIVSTVNELTLGSNPSAKQGDQGEPLSPVSPISLWTSKIITQTPHSPMLSASPSQVHGSPVEEEPPAPLLDSKTSETSKLSRSRSRMNAPGRIRTSSTSTISSIATPTTPSTFSSVSGNALLESLAANAQLINPMTSQGPCSGAGTGTDANTGTGAHPSSCIPLGNTEGIHPQTRTSRQNSVRLSIPRLSLPPSAPSTAFCKTTVNAITHATTSVDDLEPASTVLGTADQYGTPIIGAITPPTPGTPSSAMALPCSRSITSTETRPFGSGSKPNASVYPKVDSGKFVGSHHSATSSTSSSTKSYYGSTGVPTSSGNSSGVSSSAIIEHCISGTAQEFESSFRNESYLDSNPQSLDRRRDSATSLRGIKSVSSQPQVILLGNHTLVGNVVVDHHHPGGTRPPRDLGGEGEGGGRTRQTIPFGDLPSSLPTSNSLRSQTPHPLESSRQKAKQTMLGDFLSELAKVEDGDVLVGNRRDGVMKVFQ